MVLPQYFFLLFEISLHFPGFLFSVLSYPSYIQSLLAAWHVANKFVFREAEGFLTADCVCIGLINYAALLYAQRSTVEDMTCLAPFFIRHVWAMTSLNENCHH